MSLAEAQARWPSLKIPPANRRRPQPKSKSEELFAMLCGVNQLPPFEREFLFAESIARRWRFDFAWPTLLVAVEIEGLVKRFIGNVPYAVGRHCTFQGFADDCVKYAHANILGWHVLRFNQALVKDGTAIELTRRLLAARELMA